MKLPNFLIIGAAKAGTTSLHYYIGQHPQVYMSPLKEPRFFALEGERLNFQNPDREINQSSVTTFSDYCNLFEGVTDEIAIGEASPLYLYSTKAIERISHYVPDAKLIAILRNPVDRAYSCYKHLIALEKFSFAESLHEEENRIHQNWAHLWHYKQGGYYYRQLKPYFEKFGDDKIRVYLFDDLKSNPLDVVSNAFSFLGVDSSFIPDFTYKNVSNNPKVKVLQNIVSTKNWIRFLSKKVFPESLRKSIAQEIRSWNSKEFPPMPEDIRLQLIEDYREDVLQLQDLIKTDLSQWLK